jgi:hypothetical protein
MWCGNMGSCHSIGSIYFILLCHAIGAAAVPIHLHSLRVLLGARFLRRASLIAWWPSLVVLPVPAVFSLVLSVVKLFAVYHHSVGDVTWE